MRLFHAVNSCGEGPRGRESPFRAGLPKNPEYSVKFSGGRFYNPSGGRGVPTRFN